MRMYLHKCGCVSFKPVRSRSNPAIMKFLRLFNCRNAEYCLEEGITPRAVHEAKRLPSTQTEIFLDGYNDHIKRREACLLT